VDNSRILTTLANIVAEGGLGNDISDLPAAGAAPEWMSEKAVSIGMYFVASGVYTMIGKPLPHCFYLILIWGYCGYLYLVSCEVKWNSISALLFIIFVVLSINFTIKRELE